MNDSIVLEPIRLVSGTVKLPGSKSFSNRVLVLSLLAEGVTHIQNLLDSEDVRHMVGALAKLKISFDENRKQQEITITGCGGKIPVEGASLFLGNAGTAMRSLTAVLSIGKGKFILDGIPRMRQRPIQDLVDGLVQLGVHVQCIENNNCPPVELNVSGLPGGIAFLNGAISSQYLSAMLMAAPYAQNMVEIVIKDKLVSLPYVQMTLNLMERFGVCVEHDNYQKFHIQPRQIYQSPGTVYVEGDASSASYFLGAAAITGSTITVMGCGAESVQGDTQFARVLEKMGAHVEYLPHSIQLTGHTLRGIDVDMNDMPDAAMTLAVVALFAEGKTTIRNISNWQLKESERITAVSTELRKLGAQVDAGNDYISIVPPDNVSSATIDTYDDHRMAMAFSLAACGEVPITINNPDVVIKTFPEYFEAFSSVISH
ncbi:MAG: 3-phosphoshikimate 1-carboxyvinyltransferase [SAR324 cluster bacterium]|nr:3-phosphoshikimate 1-carboxyvinyltransferase [SAR324 cluster bacterium]